VIEPKYDKEFGNWSEKHIHGELNMNVHFTMCFIEVQTSRKSFVSIGEKPSGIQMNTGAFGKISDTDSSMVSEADKSKRDILLYLLWNAYGRSKGYDPSAHRKSRHLVAGRHQSGLEKRTGVSVGSCHRSLDDAGGPLAWQNCGGASPADRILYVDSHY
jgi:hypothetical protein